MGEGKGLACPYVLGLWGWGEYPSFSSRFWEDTSQGWEIEV